MTSRTALAGSSAGRTRSQQSADTYDRLLDIAVQVLIEDGVARTTTLEVQKRAGVSRGALLHHFPTRADLLSAAVGRLVEMNERAVWQEAEAMSGCPDPVERTVRTLTNAFSHPSFVAELELWAVARTDEPLRQSLRLEERKARASRDRVLEQLFAPMADNTRTALVGELSTEFIRGLTLSTILRTDLSKREKLIREWIVVARTMLNLPDGE